MAVGALAVALATGLAGVALAQPTQPGVTTQTPPPAPEEPGELKAANPQAPPVPRAPRSTPKPEPAPEPKPHAVQFGDVTVPVPNEVPVDVVDSWNKALNGGQPRP
ncbi:hypothetical protein ACWDYH_05150 [Nocardia goodfellowii]